MSLNSCNGNNSEGVQGAVDALELRQNVGRVVTLFTTSGGCSGNGFTGLLADVDRNSCKLITSLPTAPRNPFGVQSANNFHNHCNNQLGTVIVIPVNKICAAVYNEI